MGVFFGGVLKFQIYFGLLEIPVFFFFWRGVNGRCWARAYDVVRMKKK